MDYRKELEKARRAIKDLPRTGAGDTIEAYWEVCCGDVLVAEENQREMRRVWEISQLAKEFLDIAKYLEGYDHMLNKLYEGVSRMTDTVEGHPSLKLKLMNFNLLVLRRLNPGHEGDLSIMEDLMEQINLYESNIERADRGELYAIEDERLLKYDPIEWTAGYEACYDDVERMVDDMLADHPRGMGYCHAYWSARQQVLREHFGINWRTPSEMNPGVLFD